MKRVSAVAVLLLVAGSIFVPGWHGSEAAAESSQAGADVHGDLLESLLQTSQQGRVLLKDLGLAPQIWEGSPLVRSGWTPRHPWPPLRFTLRHFAASVLCAIAAAFCSAAGVGGGGLFVPLFNLVVGFGPKTSTALSQAVIASGTLVSVAYNLKRKHPKVDSTLVDFDLVMLLVPPLLLGISCGVTLNVVFPAWLIVMLLSILLIYMSFYTFKKGRQLWGFETKLAETPREDGPTCVLQQLEEEEEKQEGGMTLMEGMEAYEALSMLDAKTRESLEAPLLEKLSPKRRKKRSPQSSAVQPQQQESRTVPVPWLRLLKVLVVWGLFFSLQLLKGGKTTPSVFGIDSCDWQYWALNALQVPLTILLVWWEGRYLVAGARDRPQPEEGAIHWTTRAVALYPSLSFLAGCLVGLLGIGGGMVINPLLLEMGVIPQVTAATSFVLIFFSASMATAQFAIIGMLPVLTAAWYGLLCMVFSLVGNTVVRYFIASRGRASIIVFALGIVVLTSAVLIGSLGSIAVIEDVRAGAPTGFKPFCEHN